MLRKAVLAFVFCIVFLQQVSNAEEVWQELNSGISDLDVRSISLFSGDDNFVCASSANSVYFSENGGSFWKEIFSLRAEADEINFVSFSSCDPKIIYLATTKGLFITKDVGKNWQRVFRKVEEAASNVGWIALDSLNRQKIYIGTEEGLYASQDSGATWQKCNGGLPHSQVSSVVVHPANSQVLYLANTYGLFKSIDASRSWERIYVTSYRIGEDEDEGESSQVEDTQNLINCIAIDKNNPKRIFIATGLGVFVSPDAGETWSKLPTQGLSCDYVNFIVVPDKKDAVYAATENGVFEFSSVSNSWQEIYQGMTARGVYSLALNMSGKELFAGTDKGVFGATKKVAALPIPKAPKEVKTIQRNKLDTEEVLKELSLNEPTIQEIREAALEYAEVIHPENIKALRRNARLKALLPSVSLDYDKTIKDGGTTGNFGKFIVGPRDWGFNLSWDIGDLVFSEQVRLIDSNVRLMVQLRDDILSEVTRYYYERRKLQTELVLMPPKTPQEDLTKTLRLEELTANIDALTGGYFSRHLESKVNY